MRAYQILTLLGGALLVAGLFLPLWAKNGIAVTGWEGDFLAIGRWVLLMAGLGANVFAFLPRIRKPSRIALCGILGLGQTCLIIWKGYKLHAVGYGVGMLVAGGLLILIAAILLKRSERQQLHARDSTS